MMWLVSKRGLVIASFIMILTTALFWLTDLDLWAATFFYHPEASDPWFEGDLPLWAFMYQMGPIISISIAVGSIITIIVSGVKNSWARYRVQSVFILICFVVGPGLLVNTVFKDHWGRPRPAQIQEFSGAESYVPPGMYNSQGNGKSFPSGHSSVGFALIAFFFLWQKRHKRLAITALVSSLSIGILLGLARMAAGGHFLSDVIWSMFITFLVSAGLYRLYCDKLEDSYLPTKLSRRLGWVYSIIAFLVLSIGLFNWPFKVNETYLSSDKNYQTIKVSSGQLELVLVPVTESSEIRVSIVLKGFGLPGSTVVLTQKVDNQTFWIETVEEGLLTEVEGKLIIQANPKLLERIEPQITSPSLQSVETLPLGIK